MEDKFEYKVYEDEKPLPQATADREKLVMLLHDVGRNVMIYKTDCFIESLANYLIANGVTFGKDNDVHTKWIPVSERLPEKPGKYLVTGRSYRERIPQIWICDFIIFGLCGGWSNNAKNPIVEAWMPLPERREG